MDKRRRFHVAWCVIHPRTAVEHHGEYHCPCGYVYGRFTPYEAYQMNLTAEAPAS